MTQNSQAPKSKWGVGTLFQQAVAGVESRLDNILLDPEDQAKLSSAKVHETENKEAPLSKSPAGCKDAKLHLVSLGPVPANLCAAISRNPSNARKNDRLQERLARAMAKSNAAKRNSQSSPSRVSSSAASPVPSNDARSSMDIDSSLASAAGVSDSPRSPPPHELTNTADTIAGRPSSDLDISHNKSTEASAPELLPPNASEVAGRPSDVEMPDQGSTDSQQSEVISARLSSDGIRKNADPPPGTVAGNDDSTESQRQEEIHGYIERIDALQSKLKYLAKEAALSARNNAASASPGSTKKQLLEKDEKIALLLEEGQKLSKSEMDHRTIIKKLRQQLAENTKAQTDLKKRTDKLERDLATSDARAKRAEAAEKRASDSLLAQTKLAKDLEAVTNERNALSQTVQEMKAQLSRAVTRAETAEAQAHSDALEVEKRRANELEEELMNTKIERDISEEKAKKEITELNDRVNEEKERYRILESELKGEQSVLESKMESLRSRAEEASSGATGETQAKLLRQIETLQTQYSVASENWHTLEGSLLSRLSNVEKERDDAGRRESDLRKKIRELVLCALKLKHGLF